MCHVVEDGYENNPKYSWSLRVSLGKVVGTSECRRDAPGTADPLEHQQVERRRGRGKGLFHYDGSLF